MWWKKYKATGWGEELMWPIWGLQVAEENGSLEIGRTVSVGKTMESTREQF